MASLYICYLCSYKWCPLDISGAHAFTTLRRHYLFLVHNDWRSIIADIHSRRHAYHEIENLESIRPCRGLYSTNLYDWMSRVSLIKPNIANACCTRVSNVQTLGSMIRVCRDILFRLEVIYRRIYGARKKTRMDLITIFRE